MWCRLFSFLLAYAAGLFGLLLLSSVAFAAESAWVQTGVSGRLIYVPDAEGDRVLDFSNVGYRGKGTQLLPGDIPSVISLSPIEGDDTAQIQAAINHVGSLPIGPDGYRGAVLLHPGAYDIDSHLEIHASGVVLRGSGSGDGGTVLHGRNPLTGGSNPNQRPLVRIFGNGNRTDAGPTRTMVDKVVPAGARSFRVDSAVGFAVGDTVRIERPSTAEWIDAIGMDNPPDGDPPWQPGTMNLRYDRTITRIEGDRIFLDAPIANSFELAYGGGTVRKYSWTGAIENVGVENLRGDSDYDSPTDEDHAWEFISIGQSQNSNRAQNVWVRDIEARHFGDSVVVANPGSKWVTVTNAASTEPVSIVTGERRYTYDLSGELGFVTNSTADSGRHDFVNNSTRPAGPNVFHNSTASNALNDSGPHQRWATGTLFDNIIVDGNNINARNRGSFGTSHGWSGANMVIWNSQADGFAVQNPPTAQNWLIGSKGNIVNDTTFGPQPPGYYDQSGPGAAPVTVGGTTSLYEAQMNDAADVVEFRNKGISGNWSDPATWQQDLAPVDSYSVALRDYLIGDIDGFVYDGTGSVDNVYVDSAWQSAVVASSALPLTRLDDLSGNENVAFTVQHTLDSGERVIHASLALALRQTGGNTQNDFIRLFNMDPQNTLSFTQLGWDSQLSDAQTFVGVLDLGVSLPHLQMGNINVQVSNDTAVDWALYTATVATPRGDSSVTSVLLEGGGTIALSEIVTVGHLEIAGDSELLFRSTAQLSVVGGFTQFTHGKLNFELGETLTTPLTVGGVAQLSGLLEVSLPDGSQPSPGDIFPLIAGQSVLGTFSDVALPDLLPGLKWNLAYSDDAVSLVVHYSADFDLDGTVGSSDLVIWQSAYGVSLLGDADGDGDTDGRDFLVWQRQFGSAVNLSAVTSSVPEPSSLLMVLTTSLFCAIARGRRAL